MHDESDGRGCTHATLGFIFKWHGYNFYISSLLYFSIKYQGKASQSQFKVELFHFDRSGGERCASVCSVTGKQSAGLWLHPISGPFLKDGYLTTFSLSAKEKRPAINGTVERNVVSLSTVVLWRNVPFGFQVNEIYHEESLGVHINVVLVRMIMLGYAKVSSHLQFLWNTPAVFRKGLKLLLFSAGKRKVGKLDLTPCEALWAAYSEVHLE